MTIDPAPSDDETAAILAVLERAYGATNIQPKNAAPSRWRLAGRVYPSDDLRSAKHA